MLFTHLASKMMYPIDDPALHHPPWHENVEKNACIYGKKNVFSEDNEKEHPKHAKLYVCRTIPQSWQYTFKTMWRHWSDINSVVRATPKRLPEIHDWLPNLAKSYNEHYVSARV
jgi:hypothetical protein